MTHQDLGDLVYNHIHVLSYDMSVTVTRFISLVKEVYDNPKTNAMCDELATKSGFITRKSNSIILDLV